MPTDAPVPSSFPLPPYSFSTLLDLSLNSQILFRIHDPTSSSPLFWTGRTSSSGFAAPNLNLASLEPGPYSKIYTSHNPALITDKSEPEGWAAGKYIRQTILDHVMGKEKQSCLPTLTSIDERPDTPEDEKTPWISTSIDLMWCIYEIVRRLVSLEKGSVYITIIKHPNSPSLRSPVEKKHNETHSGPSVNSSSTPYRGVELLINPYPLLRINHLKAKDLILSVGMRENYELAARASRFSSERLFWGRIFSESIMTNMEFTMTYTPLEIPAQCYQGKVADTGKRRKRGKSWTDGLVWDPREDAFDTAYRKVLDRAKAIAILAGHEVAIMRIRSELRRTGKLCELEPPNSRAAIEELLVSDVFSEVESV